MTDRLLGAGAISHKAISNTEHRRPGARDRRSGREVVAAGATLAFGRLPRRRPASLAPSSACLSAIFGSWLGYEIKARAFPEQT